MSAEPRVTVAQVRLIISTTLTDDQITAFIGSAHTLVDTVLAASGLPETLLTEIEKWLSAHFLAIRDQRAQSEKIGQEYSVTYQGQTGMGLQATTYGQQALALDTTGALANLSMKKASLQVF